MEISPQPQGPGFVPISISGDTNPVTGECTVSFEVSLPDESEPALDLGFYEVKQKKSPSEENSTNQTGGSVQQVAFLPIAVTNTPTVSWNDGVGSFSLVMDSSIFSQLSSAQTNFAVTAQISGYSNSFGMCNFGISL